MSRRLVPALVLGVLVGSCSPVGSPPATTGVPAEAVDGSTTTPTVAPPRTTPVRIEAVLDVTDGVSATLSFEVPVGATVVSILARARSPETLIQLGSLTVGGSEVTAVDPSEGRDMSRRFTEHEIVESSPGFVHEVQQDSYAFTYPFAPGWDLPAGPASLSFLVAGASELDVEVLVLGGEARTVLPVTIFEPGESRLAQDARSRVEDIFDRASITVRWRTGVVPAGMPSEIDDVEDRRPGSALHALFAAVAGRSAGGANLFVVDSLPNGLSGIASGVPGPHDGTGVAVTVTFRSPAETARLVAHEVAHLLGLRHLEDRSSTGVVVRNPILDTYADAYNLMQFGTNLTDGQIAVLRISPLLIAADD